MFVLLPLLALAACSLRPRPVESIPTIDPAATNETKALFINLWTLSRTNNTLFGHQDTVSYGVGWRAEPGRSDVLETAGQYPAVYGWDVAEIELGGEANVDGVRFDDMRRWIIEAYQRGGVNTVSWHMFNPVTLENFYDTSGRPMFHILPGQDQHDRFVSWLDTFADFALSLRSGPTAWNPEEHLVPIVFRPVHEHNGSVFWWGGRNTNEAEYIAIWRFTVEYLRDERGVHNLLYAFSPDARYFPRDGLFPGTYDQDEFNHAYFYAYPGDSYVDVFGLDDYEDLWHNRRDPFAQAMAFTIDLANNRSDLKIPALTEAGIEELINRNGFQDDWFTNFLLPTIRGAPTSNGQVAWALLWRNAAEDHYWVPYASHPSSDLKRDFADFADSSRILFQDQLPFNLYEWPH
jgi:mannan endo-1,4-beta-mannosidase